MQPCANILEETTESGIGKQIQLLSCCFQYSLLLDCDYPAVSGLSQCENERGQAKKHGHVFPKSKNFLTQVLF